MCRVYDPNNVSQPFLDPAGPRLFEIYDAISVGASSFLAAEYTICVYFTIIFGILVSMPSMLDCSEGAKKA